MDAVVEAVLCVAVASALVAFAWKKGFLTASGAVASLLSASVIGIAASFEWMVAYILFPVVGFIATRWSFQRKKDLGLQEGTHGERSAANIVGVGLFSTLIAIAYGLTDGYDDELAVAFISAMAVSVSDTIASEVGVVDRRTWMITTMKPCEPGINGGISVVGTVVSAIAAVAYSIVCCLLMLEDPGLIVLVPAVCGMLGNLLDSVLGQVLENKGLISKYTNNAMTQMFGAVLGFAIAYAWRGRLPKPCNISDSGNVVPSRLFRQS